MGNRKNLLEIKQMIEEGKLEPQISHTLHYTEIKKAHKLLEDGKQTGKIIVEFN